MTKEQRVLSQCNKQEWNAAADVYAAGKMGIAAQDDLCCVMLPDDLRGNRILDAGCGCGQVSRFLAQQGATVVGIDISDDLIAKAKADEKANPLDIAYSIHDLIEELPFDAGSFDIAISVMAIMDVQDPLAAIRNIGSVIRVGGLFIFSILHPCFYRPQINVSEDGFDLKHYYNRERVEGRYIESEDGTRVDYQQFHRTLGDYLNTLSDCGFCLLRFFEPEDSRLALSCRKIGHPS